MALSKLDGFPEPVITTAFPEPVSYTCADVRSMPVGYTLDFRHGEYTYVIHIPDSVNRNMIDKVTPLLSLNE